MRVYRAQPQGHRAARRTVLAIAFCALVPVGLAAAAVMPEATAALTISVVEGTNPDNQHYDASTGTLYYNPASDGDFTVEAIPADSAEIESVDFPTLSVDGFAGGASTDSSPPFVSTAYSFTGANALAPEPVSVVGRDRAGNSVSAQLSFFRDVDAPVGQLTGPAEGATVSGTVTLTAEATDVGGVGVSSVAFQTSPAAGGAYATVATDTSPPYDATWSTTTVPEGLNLVRLLVTDRVGNTAASTALTLNVTKLDTTNAWKKVTVGPGLAEASSRQVIRTLDGRVYVFAADDSTQKAASGAGVIRAYRADETGIATSFSEADGAERPTGEAPDGVLGGPDVRLDSRGVAHVLYVDKANDTLVYQTFSTLTDTWGPASTIATDVTVGTHPFKRGETASALVLDANDTVHVVYTSFGSVLYRRNEAGTWTAPETVATGPEPIHPQLAAETNGDLQVVWLEQGLTPKVLWAKRAAGAWGTPETVASDVLGNSNLDQGPSIVLDSANQARVLFLSCCAPSTTYVRVMARTDAGWVPDTMPYDLYAHTPQIYGRGDDVYVFLGHDDQIRFGYAYHLHGEPWSPYTPLTSLADGELDGSASARWDPLHETNPNVIDVAFFDEDKNGDQSWMPELYYMAVLPSASGPPVDGIPPTVALTAPDEGATVSGMVTVSADAADDVGVAGVHFLVDGAPVGVEDTSAPYSFTWDTTAVVDGSHELTAVARDAAGNVTASAAWMVTVSNSAPAPPGTRLLGEDTIFGYTDFNPPGTAEAFQVTATAAGTLGTIHLYVDATSTASSVMVAIYSDADGQPGIRLDEGRLVHPEIVEGAWNSIPLLGHLKTSVGAKYWIALLTPIGDGEIRFRDVGMGNGSTSTRTSAGVSLAGWPDLWVTGASYLDGPLSAYGTS